MAVVGLPYTGVVIWRRWSAQATAVARTRGVADVEERRSDLEAAVERDRRAAIVGDVYGRSGEGEAEQLKALSSREEQR